MSHQSYRYKQSVLDELKRFGILPQPTTDPVMIREVLNGLYVYEIRKLKEQQVALEREQGRQARKGYADKVVALKQKYPLLSLPLERWLEGS
jgi:hypothetical protein